MSNQRFLWTSSVLVFMLCASLTVRAKLVFYEGWEAGCWNAINNQGSSAGSCDKGKVWNSSQMQGDYSGEAVTTPTPREGKYCMKFEWHRSAASGENTKEKAMQHFFPQPPNPVERWYGFSVYFPAATTKPDNEGFVLLQIHDRPDPGEDWRQPVTGFGMNKGRLSFWHTYDNAKISPGNSNIKKNHKGYDLGSPPRDTWVDFVLHYIFDLTGKGVAELWIDGAKKVDRHNISLGYNDESGHFFSIGIYHPNSKSDHEVTKIFVDCIRMGDENSSYEEVAPGTGAPDPEAGLPSAEEIDFNAAHIKLNFGGGGIEGWVDGTSFSQGGEPYRFSYPVKPGTMKGTAPEPVYASCIHKIEGGGNVSILFPTVPNGDYLLRMHLADHFGNRAIDISAEGKKVVENLDPITEAGGEMVPLVTDAPVTIADGNGLEIVLSDDSPTWGDAFLCGLEIVRNGTVPVRPAGRNAFGAGLRRDASTERVFLPSGRSVPAFCSPLMILLRDEGVPARTTGGVKRR